MLLPPMPIERLSGRAVTIEDASLEACRIRDGQIDNLLASVGQFHLAGVRRLSIAPFPVHALRGFTWRDWPNRPCHLRIAHPVETMAAASEAIAAKPDTIILRIGARDRQRSMDQMSEVMAMTPPDILLGVAIEAAFGTSANRVDNELAVDIGDFFASNGASEIILCDTSGLAGPLRIEQGCDGLCERWAGKEVVVEVNDTYGMASANIIAAMAAGIDHFRLATAPESGARRLSHAELVTMLLAMECIPNGNIARASRHD
ncbi:hypothetical protein [Cupriavidus necator]|uniref:Uncharacterized protein n=1 Tax=Cupriavidus pinatubonensis (strain JMP 134 / LMG 1197) TaxID=264198 RepID=Q46MR6_CUPPJ|nr:hypothetical protein [Cupriavidus necator]